MKIEIPKSEDTSSVFHPDVKAEDEKPQDIALKTELVKFHSSSAFYHCSGLLTVWQAG